MKIFAAALLALILGCAAVIGASYIGAYNFGNRAEKSLSAAVDHNKNVLSAYTLKIREAAQIPEKYTDALTKVVKAAMESRYGADGSKATWQFITEQNPNVDPALFIKLQQIIEAGRTEFRVAQDELIDKKRIYETALGSFWQGFWLRVAGYPKTDLSQFKVITDSQTDKAFESGKQEPMKF